MPNRIEHVFDAGVEKKWCWKCKEFHPVNEFSKCFRQWDGLNHYCKNCSKKRAEDPEWCARNVYRNIQKRIKTKNYARKNIQCKMTFVEFKEWYIPRYFKGCLLDRKDNNGHYELGNLQLLTRKEHNHKLRNDNLKDAGIIEPKGYRFCTKCKQLKQEKNFYAKKSKVNKYNPLGLIESCKDCCKQERKERYKKLGV